MEGSGRQAFQHVTVSSTRPTTRMTASRLEGAWLPRVLSACRWLLLAATGASSVVIAAPNLAQLEALSPGASPVVATRAALSVAVVFPSKDSAQLLVFRGSSVAAKSAAFEFPLVANYGAAWVDVIDISSTDRFTIRMRTRQTCGAGIYDYRFSERQEAWVVSGLDRAEHECSKAGITQASRAAYDFLNGTIVRTQTYRGARPEKSTTHRAFTAFPLAGFEAFSSLYEPE